MAETTRSESVEDEATATTAALALALPAQIDIPGIPDIPDFEEVFRKGIEWLVGTVARATLEALDAVFLVGYERFLFFRNPAEIDALSELWWTSFAVFGLLAGVAFLYILLMAMLFPGTDSADLQVFLERVAKYFVVVFLSREIVAVAVSFTHALTGAYYGGRLELTRGTAIALALIDDVGVWLGLQLSALATLALALAGIGFQLLLLVRMLVVYVTYALLPLFMGFKLVKIGPWSTLDEMGEKFVKTTAKLLLFGIVITAVLWVSTAVTDYGEYDDRASFEGGDPAAAEVDARFAPSWVSTFEDLIIFVTPLLLLNYMGFQLVMELV